ncbi:MAG: AgmX/PglI C-terminal domain-containing protein, partial [Deltaproteobacteria bacterium]|nr:AgmX/PglI C-terminal domain-containing protein [Deltaproteobacteria bacterium]
EGRLTLAGTPIDVKRLREGDLLDLGPVQLRLTYQRGDDASPSPRPVPQAARAVPQALADEEGPTDADVAAPFRSGQPARAPFQDEDQPTHAGPLTEAPTQTMRAMPREGQKEEAPTQAMPSMQRPPEPAPATARPAPTPVHPRPVASTPAKREAGVLPVVRSPLQTEPELQALVLDPVPLLTITPGPGMRRAVPLPVGTFEVGSEPCALRLNHAGVAPRHAALMVMPDGAVYVRHLAGESAATTHNGAPLSYSRVQPGDSLTIGTVSLALAAVPLDELARALRAPPPAAPPPGPSPEQLEHVTSRPSYEDDSEVGVAPPFGSPFPFERGPTGSSSMPAVPDPAPDLPVTAPQLSAPPPPDPAITLAKPPAPAPALVRRKKSTPRAKVPTRAVATAPSPPVDYTDDFEIDYRKPLWQRAAVPAVIAALLAVIGFQFWAYRQEGTPAASRGPRVAGGQAPDTGLQVDTAGGGTMVVGNPRRASGAGGGGQPVEYLGAGSSGGYGGASGYIDPANDWDPTVPSRTYGSHGDTPGSAQRATAEQIDSAAEADALDAAEFAAEKAAARRAQEEAAEARGAPSPQKGYVEMKDVEDVIYRDRKKLRYCYTSARESNPSLSGVMWLSLTLGTDGRIRQASLESRSTVRDDALFKCVRRQLSTMAMPPAQNASVSFSYPFELTQ